MAFGGSGAGVSVDDGGTARRAVSPARSRARPMIERVHSLSASSLFPPALRSTSSTTPRRIRVGVRGPVRLRIRPARAGEQQPASSTVSNAAGPAMRQRFRMAAGDIREASQDAAGCVF